MNVIQSAPRWAQKTLSQFKSGGLPSTIKQTSKDEDYNRVSHEASEARFFFHNLDFYDEGIHDAAKGLPGVVQLESGMRSYYEKTDRGTEVVNVFAQPGEEPTGVWYAFMGQKPDTDLALHLKPLEVDGQSAVSVRGATSLNGDYGKGTMLDGWALT